MSASRATISHPQLRCCQSKKRLCLQCKSYQYNQRIVLRISLSNSIFPWHISKQRHRNSSWTSCESHFSQSLSWICQQLVSILSISDCL